MSEPLDVKVYANGEWHPMPMTPADAGRLIHERDAAIAERNDVVSHLADWHEDNDTVMEICQRRYDSPLDLLAAVRAWLDLV